MRVFTGQEKSPCTSPCRTFHTKTKFLEGRKETQDHSFRMMISFIPEMTVTITDFVKPTISSMLSEVAYNYNQNQLYIVIGFIVKVGGSMGLWLGLGVVQAIQLFATYLLPLLKRQKHEKSIKVAS